ncbi:MAG TPA: delta-aminolevulinic acid dehydratase [Planctomycetes bacterium]|nr:delta-aminolevulinic acid dehydratase [Planctomycetota bacterium]
MERQGLRGYDPYDALNSPVLRLFTFGHKYARIAAIQTLKRCPINLRPMLLIRKDWNPKGLGLFLWGYAKLHRLQTGTPLPAPYLRTINHQPSTSNRQPPPPGSCSLNPQRLPPALDQIDRLLDLLADLRSRNCSGHGWGYNFDWQSRAFFVPKGTPTIVNSSFIGHALLDTYAHTGRERALGLALPIKDFILKDLNRTVDRDSFCFSYTPIDHLAVHNANLLGASLLIRLQRYDRDTRARDAALGALRYSMRRQQTDGSWWYADTDYQRWIDSFHTGFNLQAIRYFLEEGYGEGYREAYQRGVRFYAENFFLPDGTAKYYHDRLEPLDIHSFAQAVVFFSGEGKGYRELAGRVLQRMIELFQSPKGYFYFQRRGRRLIKIPYMRWSQAWAFHALTEYLLKRASTNES